MKKQDILVLILIAAAVVLTVCFFVNPSYESRYFNPDTVNKLDIIIDEDDWADLQKNPKSNKYQVCTIILNGDTYESVGIKPRGATSLSDVVSHKSVRFPFKIKVDKYISDQTIYGLDEFVLNNNHLDPTAMKEFLSYELMDELGVPTPLHSYAALYINGEYFGLYLMVESVEDGFMYRNFGGGYGHLYRPSYSYDSKTKTYHYDGSRLEYIDDNISSYKGLFRKVVFDKTTDEDKKRLINSLKNIKEKKNISQYVDLKNVLPYLAANAALPSTDTFTNAKNYFLYEENGKISIIPWDYNLAFGTISYGDATAAVNARSDTHCSSHPLISSLFSNKEYKDEYLNYLKSAAENFLGEKFSQRVDNTDSLIRDYIKTDPTSFYTFDEYQTGVENLKKYGVLRGKAISQQLNGDFTKVNAKDINFSSMGLYSEMSKMWKK